MPDITLDSIRADFFKALAHPSRIKILRLLRSGEKNVMELQEGLGIEPSGASQQLALMRSKNLVTARKEGTRVYYSVTDPGIFQLLDSVKQILDNQHVYYKTMIDEFEREETLMIKTADSDENF